MTNYPSFYIMSLATFLELTLCSLGLFRYRVWGCGFTVAVVASAV